MGVLLAVGVGWDSRADSVGDGGAVADTGTADVDNGVDGADRVSGGGVPGRD